MSTKYLPGSEYGIFSNIAAHSNKSSTSTAGPLSPDVSNIFGEKKILSVWHSLVKLFHRDQSSISVQ
jgi:hypothetical protein